MRFPGDQLMIFLRSLILLKENRYVSVRWEQDASNALVPVWCDEDAAEVWREMYQKSYVFNRIFNSAPSDELKPGHWVIYASIGYAVEIKAPWMMSNWRYAWTYMIFCTFHVIPRLHLHHIKREQVHWTCLIPSLPRHIYFLSRWQVIINISSVDHLRFHLLCCLIAVTWPWNHGKVSLAKNKNKCFEKCFQNKANCQKIFQNNWEYWGSFWKKLSVWAVDIEISQSQKSKL